MLVGFLKFGFSSVSRLSKSPSQFVEKPPRSSWRPAVLKKRFSSFQCNAFVAMSLSTCDKHSTRLASKTSGSTGNELGTVDIAPLIRPAAEALGLELIVDGLMTWDLVPPTARSLDRSRTAGCKGHSRPPSLSVRMNGPASEDAIPEATSLGVRCPLSQPSVIGRATSDLLTYTSSIPELPALPIINTLPASKSSCRACL